MPKLVYYYQKKENINGSLRIEINAVNYTHREKLFYSIQYKNGCLAASELFHMFTQSIKF